MPYDWMPFARSWAWSLAPVDIDGSTAAPGYIVLATCSIRRYISVSSLDAGDGGRLCGSGTIFTAGSAITFAISA